VAASLECRKRSGYSSARYAECSAALITACQNIVYIPRATCICYFPLSLSRSLAPFLSLDVSTYVGTEIRAELCSGALSRSALRPARRVVRIRATPDISAISVSGLRRRGWPFEAEEKRRALKSLRSSELAARARISRGAHTFRRKYFHARVSIRYSARFAKRKYIRQVARVSGKFLHKNVRTCFL